MAEAILAVGLAASIITCMGMTATVMKQLDFHMQRSKNPPRIFAVLLDQLPLLMHTFEQIKAACDHDQINEESQGKLVRTVQGCIRPTGELEFFLEECLPTPGDSMSQKAMKVYKSLRAEKKITNVHRMLEAYKSTLTSAIQRSCQNRAIASQMPNSKGGIMKCLLWGY